MVDLILHNHFMVDHVPEGAFPVLQRKQAEVDGLVDLMVYVRHYGYGSSGMCDGRPLFFGMYAT